MSTIIEIVAPRLLGPALMFAAALIVKSYTDVGDGFSGGVIVALAVALRYIALGREEAERGLPALRRAPVIAAAGLLLALGVGFAGIFILFGFFVNDISPAVNAIVSRRGLDFPVLDVGWPPLAAITWASMSRSPARTLC